MTARMSICAAMWTFTNEVQLKSFFMLFVLCMVQHLGWLEWKKKLLLPEIIGPSGIFLDLFLYYDGNKLVKLLQYDFSLTVKLTQMKKWCLSFDTQAK